ncbi:hypothetical protein FA743_19855 [Paracoccus gahaiensis]|uniref:Uncharacterized protein n=1 Tax=Paracoccus gahaiensis TaxID=1706839 RepID=A0A4U0R1U9_9RHOB|nr:hypothetical protein [Paracoccus gahaiensis]TJZ88743.1 hypothetical protein FA743_19855 [Paracoccus gahaiensis]
MKNALLRGLSHPLLIPAWLGLVAAAAAIGAWLWLPDQRDTSLILDLQSNHVQFKVSRPATAVVVVREGWLGRRVQCDSLGSGRSEDALPVPLGPGPLAALLAPAAGTLVEYIWQPRSLKLRYAPTPGQTGPFLTVMRDAEPECDISRESVVVTLPHAALTTMAPLPVVGTGSVGRVVQERTAPTPRVKVFLPGSQVEDLPSPGNYLHGGTIRVYAHARTSPPTIFPVPDADFEVPRNSQIEFGRHDTDDTRDFTAEPAVFGWVALDPEGRGMSLHALTNASDITIAGMGGVTAVSAGTLAVAVNDPVNMRLLTALAVFIFLFPTLIAAWQLAVGSRGNR